MYFQIHSWSHITVTDRNIEKKPQNPTTITWNQHPTNAYSTETTTYFTKTRKSTAHIGQFPHSNIPTRSLMPKPKRVKYFSATHQFEYGIPAQTQQNPKQNKMGKKETSSRSCRLKTKSLGREWKVRRKKNRRRETRRARRRGDDERRRKWWVYLKSWELLRRFKVASDIVVGSGFWWL